MTTYEKFPASSHVSFDGISDAQVYVAAAALEQVAERMDKQGQEGAASITKQLCRALCEQLMARMEDQRRGQQDEQQQPTN